MTILDLLLALAGYVVPFALLMWIVVVVHEWGHYYAARIIGVPATEFAIGMGPTLWSVVDKDGCRWCIKLLPIGGYVKFLGSDANRTDARRSFDRRSPGDRAFVIAAGPALSLLFGMIVIAALYATTGRPYISPIVSQVVEGKPAAMAGILPGDHVTAINDLTTKDFASVIDEISMHPDKAIVVHVERNGTPLEFEMVTERVTVDSFGSKQSIGKIGIITTGPVQYRQIGPGEAIAIGANDVIRLTRSMFVALYQIGTGQRSVQEMGGPIRIAEISGEALRLDLQLFVFLIAAISINIGVMNLLPLPVLDGGQLVICAIEKSLGRPIGDRALAYMYKAGAACVVFCILALTFNDIVSIVGRIAG